MSCSTGIEQLPRPVRALALDFDGVMTDNRVLVLEDGREAVVCNRSDGLGIARLKERGISVCVLSTETNNVVVARCKKLGLECRQGLKDKKEAFVDWLNRLHLSPQEAVFVGNDVNDLECIQIAGCGVAVSDAHPDVLAQADLVLDRPGGHGAVREICDLIVASLA